MKDGEGLCSLWTREQPGPWVSFWCWEGGCWQLETNRTSLELRHQDHQVITGDHNFPMTECPIINLYPLSTPPPKPDASQEGKINDRFYTPFTVTRFSPSVELRLKAEMRFICACVHAKSLQSCPALCDPMDNACQAPLSIGFSKQEYWSGLPCPLPGDLPDPGIKPTSPPAPALQADSLPLSNQGKPWCSVTVKQRKSFSQGWVCYKWN